MIEHVNEAFHPSEGTVIGSLDGSGNFLWVVDPSTQTLETRRIVQSFCTRNKLQETERRGNQQHSRLIKSLAE
jgi:hypothetical protein